jgi:all-trans-8'-apo-beta-carotenal 15,15'-oxygenase
MNPLNLPLFLTSLTLGALTSSSPSSLAAAFDVSSSIGSNQPTRTARQQQEQQQSPSATATTFWNEDESILSELLSHDPPPPEILRCIREEPWRGGLEPVPVTIGIPKHSARVIEGSIPTDLKGMLCRNGPGRIRIGETQYGHWFDGDGLITQLIIDGSQQSATFQAKYVETERFLAQQQQLSSTATTTTAPTSRRVPLAKAGAWTKRGTGSRWENLFAIPTNPANTNVIFYPTPPLPSSASPSSSSSPPLMYALAEGGDPVKIDCITLKTIGTEQITTTDGTVSCKSFFSAHYVKDPLTGDIYNHGIVLGSIQPAVNIMKLDQYGNLIHQSSTELENISFIHDNILSDRYIVLVVPPYSAPSSAIVSSILGGDPLGKEFKWNVNNETKTVAMIFSKNTLDCVARIPLPLLSCYHLIDSYETTTSSNDETLLTIRVVVHEPTDSRIEIERCFSDLYRTANVPLCKIMEYKVNVKDSTYVDSKTVAPTARPFELPDMNHGWGYKKRYVYTNTREDHVSFANSIQKIDMETGECSSVITFGESVYAGAPIFVPKQSKEVGTNASEEEEDDGYILTQLYRANDHKSDICILDAKTMTKLTLLRLEHPVPYQFHGAWYPGNFVQE